MKEKTENQISFRELLGEKEERAKHGDYLRVLSTGLYISASLVKRLPWLGDGKKVFIDVSTDAFGKLAHIRVRPMNVLELKDNQVFTLKKRGNAKSVVINNTYIVKRLCEMFGAGVMANHPVIVDIEENQIRAKVGS